MGYILGLWSRLAEIGVRIFFVAIASIVCLLFEELEHKIENMAIKSDIDDVELNELRNQYDLVCQLIEQINRCFGFFLLLITGHDFATSIFDFSNILDLKCLKIGKIWQTNTFKRYGFRSVDSVLENGIYVELKSDPIKNCQFWHPILRYLILLVASHNVGIKVLHIQIVKSFSYLCMIIFVVLYFNRQAD